MAQEISTVTLGLPFRLGSVNCYLIETDSDYVLIDIGSANRRSELDHALDDAGCRPGNPNLIVITHGDFDHIGNAVHIRHRFGAKIAMHGGDSGMVAQGDMFWNRTRGNRLLKTISPILFGFSKADRFKADVYVEDDHNFSEFGFDAQAIHLPGHGTPFPSAALANAV